MIGDFHFLRPWCLAAIVPVVFIVVVIRARQNSSRPWRGIIAPHLLPFLLSGSAQKVTFGPLHLLALGWVVSILALAGPAWQREPAPFVNDVAALAVVVKVSPTMMSNDMEPTRLGRSVQKIHDLLAKRQGAKTSLIAYAGTAHVVMPATTDDGIINTFAAALDPGIMPVEGDDCAEALHLADETLAGTGSGSILWITDVVDPAQANALAAWRAKSSTPVRLLAPLQEGTELDALKAQAGAAHPDVVLLTPDDTDIEKLLHAAKYSTASTGDTGDHWKDAGYWLTPVIALLLLPFFRQGWMAPTASRS